MREHHSSTRQSRLGALDLLRLIAALSVVLFHYGFRGWAADGYTAVHLPALIPVIKYGYLGVSLFFVISGFVIAYSAVGRTTSEFVVARIARLYPGFIVCMTLTFAVTLLWGMPPFSTSTTQWLANLIFVSSAFGQPFMDGVYWSIVYELVFYGWMTFFIATGLFPRWLRPIVVIWLTISFINMVFLDADPVRRLVLTDFSGFFIAGLLLYDIHSGRRDLVSWVLLLTGTMVAALQAMHGAERVRVHLGIALSDPVIAGIAVGAVGLVGIALVAKRLPIPAYMVAALGSLTYPLYLIHENVGFIALNFAGGLVSPWLLVPALVTMMLCLSWAIWRYVERPGQKLVKHLLSNLVQWTQADLGEKPRLAMKARAASSAETSLPTDLRPLPHRRQCAD